MERDIERAIAFERLADKAGDDTTRAEWLARAAEIRRGLARRPRTTVEIPYETIAEVAARL